jgi:hypothetical protein
MGRRVAIQSPLWAKVRPYLKKTKTKGAGGMSQVQGLEFKPQYHQKKKKSKPYI